jgi:hypothetical protein
MKAVKADIFASFPVLEGKHSSLHIKHNAGCRVFFLDALYQVEKIPTCSYFLSILWECVWGIEA